MKVIEQLETYFVVRRNWLILDELSNAAMLVFEQLLPMEEAKKML